MRFMIKKSTVLALAIAPFFGFSQTDSVAYNFTTVHQNEATEVKSQDNTGTCWSYSTASFYEAEILRIKKESIDLSEMFVVRNIYSEKAMNYVRYHGLANFSQGSLGHDFIRAVNEYGIVPQSVYSGLLPGEAKHNHSEMEAAMKAYLDAVVKKPNGKLSPVWFAGFNSIADAYLGVQPKEFEYKGATFTPQSFAKDYLGFDANDYAYFTSFNYKPYYQDIVVEVPDNWSRGEYTNVPLNDLVAIANNALKNGYTISWDADVSESTFLPRDGVAVIPADASTDKAFFKEFITEELAVTEDYRMELFNNQQTTDDHLMHITGLAKDAKGNTYYIVKNSWGTKIGLDEFKGYVFVSEAYFKLKTISMVVHKDGVPKNIQSKIK